MPSHTLLSSKRVHFESMIEGFRVIRKDGMRRRFSGLRENEALSQLSYTPSYGSKNLTAKIPTTGSKKSKCFILCRLGARKPLFLSPQLYRMCTEPPFRCRRPHIFTEVVRRHARECTALRVCSRKFVPSLLLWTRRPIKGHR